MTIRHNSRMVKRHYEKGPEFPKFLDNNDKLGRFRQRFYTKDDSIYMCGNSLGLLSKDSEECVLQILEKWKTEGVKIWNCENSRYLLYSDHLAELTAPLIAADPEEITIMGCTTFNIHQAVSTLYKPTKDKYKVIVDDINFPTDKYAIDSQVRLKGYDPKEAVKIVKSIDNILNEDDVISAMTDDVAMVFLPAVYYRTAQIVDMKKISDAAKERGILMGWDLCHAIGSIEIDLKSSNVDFAVWCNYKYISGGPGATAGLYINRKHFSKQPGLTGWFGNKPETQFMLKQEFEHNTLSARGFQLGTPHVLAMAGIEGALKLIQEATLSEMRKKSLNITGYLIYLIDTKLEEYGFKVGNLREDSRRGGHVCLEHDEAYRISMALKKRGVVPDFRDPNVIRLTPTALYTTYSEVYEMVEILIDIAQNETYKEFDMKRSLVV